MWSLPALALTAFALTWFYRASTFRLFDEPLSSTITALIATADTGLPGQEPGEISLSREPIDQRYQQALSGRYWLIGNLSRDGVVLPIKASPSLAGETLMLPEALAAVMLDQPGAQIQTQMAGPDVGERLRVMARSVILPNMNNRPIVIMAAADSRVASKDIRNFAFLAIGLMFILSTALVLAVFMQVRVGLKPLFELRDKVVDVREGRAAHVDGNYPSEIQPLASELNSLIIHNRDIVEQAKTHVGNLAHALKTPLAVLLNEAASTKSALAVIVRRQSNTMKNQVDHHLRRARAAARGQTIGVSASVKDTLEPFARTLVRIYRDKDMAFDMDIPGDLQFRGEKTDLEEMAGNLLDNACKWTESKVCVSAAPAQNDDTMLEICVRDDGPGMPPENYAKALKRGERLDEAMPGTGFGLAIVDDLARAYKGSVTLARADIGGLSVTLRLPRRV